MIRYLVFALALFAAGPHALAAQEGQTTAAAQRVEAAKARAEQAGIPLDLLENRITEGRAKGVSEERIADAIERRGAGLARAREAMVSAGIQPTSADLSVGADAIESGVDASALRVVIQAARAEDRPVALAVLSELVRQGMPVREARDRVTQALERRGERLVDLPRRAAAERAAGVRGETGRPTNPGGGRPTGAGGAPTGGPPAGVPSARPNGAGRPDGGQGGRPTDTPGNRGGPSRQ